MAPKVYLFSTSSHPDATNINSLNITLLKPSIDFSKYDYFIITSKQAVKSLKQYQKVSLKPALCISKKTANAYEGIGGKVLDIGLGYGDSLEHIISQYSKATKWLYLRAETIASDFVIQLREDNYSIDESILYKSECSKEVSEVKVEKSATLIFTSPSSIECFLKSNDIYSSNKIILIGQTTANALPYNIKYILAKEKTIESCLELV